MQIISKLIRLERWQVKTAIMCSGTTSTFDSFILMSKASNKQAAMSGGRMRNMIKKMEVEILPGLQMHYIKVPASYLMMLTLQLFMPLMITSLSIEQGTSNSPSIRKQFSKDKK